MWKTILKDERQIKRIIWPNGERMTIGSGGVESITPYGEPGQMAEIIWFAVFRNGRITRRINTAHIDTIVYE